MNTFTVSHYITSHYKVTESAGCSRCLWVYGYCSWLLAHHSLCLGFYVPLENFSLIWSRHHFRWSALNFDLVYSVLIAIEQWGFFSMPHLLWHGTSVYRGNLRGPVTLTLVSKRLAVLLLLAVYWISRMGIMFLMVPLDTSWVCSTYIFVEL